MNELPEKHRKPPVIAERRGAVLVEFALVATLSLTLMFAVFDFGRAIFDYDLVTNGARLGTRWAMVRGHTCTTDCTLTNGLISNYVIAQSPGIPSSKLSVTTVWGPATATCTASPYNAAGCVVTVTVTYPFAFFFVPFAKGGIPLSSSSAMVVSQ